MPTYGRAAEGSFEDCSHWTEEAVAYIAANPDIRNVVVTYRIHAHLFGGHEGLYPAFPNNVDAALREARWKSYVGVSRYLAGKGKNVILVLQAPELPKSLENLLFQSSDQRGEVAGMKRAWWDERSKYVMSRLNELPAQVQVVDAANIFCDRVRCLAANHGIGYYFDDDHLSVAGARLVAGEIMKRSGTAFAARAHTVAMHK